MASAASATLNKNRRASTIHPRHDAIGAWARMQQVTAVCRQIRPFQMHLPISFRDSTIISTSNVWLNTSNTLDHHPMISTSNVWLNTFMFDIFILASYIPALYLYSWRLSTTESAGQSWGSGESGRWIRSQYRWGHTYAQTWYWSMEDYEMNWRSTETQFPTDLIESLYLYKELCAGLHTIIWRDRLERDVRATLQLITEFAL